jgi:hypothetical protein
MRELTKTEIEAISGGRMAPAPRPVVRIDLRRIALRLLELITGTRIGPLRLLGPKTIRWPRPRGRRARGLHC